MVKVENINGFSVVTFPNANRINVGNIGDFKDKVTAIITPTSKVILDLTGITYIDSSGFGMLLSFLRTSKTNESKLMFCCIMPEVMSLVNLLQLHTVFDICSSREDCLAHA
jgi:Anti-anti-sigma regulatory factor (antagonist of anti-sigma factor)